MHAVLVPSLSGRPRHVSLSASIATAEVCVTLKKLLNTVETAGLLSPNAAELNNAQHRPVTSQPAPLRCLAGPDLFTCSGESLREGNGGRDRLIGGSEME